MSRPGKKSRTEAAEAKEAEHQALTASHRGPAPGKAAGAAGRAANGGQKGGAAGAGAGAAARRHEMSKQQAAAQEEQEDDADDMHEDDDDDDDDVDVDDMEDADMSDEEDGNDHDYDDDDGDSAEQDTAGRAGKPGKAQKTKQFDPKYVAPTKQELDMLRAGVAVSETGGVLQLEVESLLQAVSVDYEALQDLQKVLFGLKEQLLALPAVENVTESLPGLPLRQYHTTDVSLAFKPPARVDLVGSFLLHTMVKPSLTVDVTVEMPSACFGERDILNFRYHDKRALYLAVIAGHLSTKTDLYQNFHFEGLAQDTTKPVLVFRPVAKHASKFAVRIIPVVAADQFAASKLAPARNSVRRAATRLVEAAAATGDEPATPHYNSSILEDMHMRTQLAMFHKTIQACPGAVRLIVMLKVWLRCADTCYLPDSINSQVITAIVVHLVRISVLQATMQPQQMLKAALFWLSQHDLRTGHISLAATAPDAELVEAMKSAFDCVIICPSGVLNLAARVSSSACAELQARAGDALSHLADASSLLHGFRRIFLQHHSSAEIYDRLYGFAYPPNPATAGRTATAVDVAGLCDLPWHRVIERRAIALVSHALGTRARIVRLAGSVACSRVASGGASVQTWRPVEWSLADCPPSTEYAMMWLGVIINPADVQRIVDRGPDAEHKAEVDAFNAFWGSKSELRRFQDGTILQSVVWDVPVHERPTIVTKIIKFVLDRHLGVSAVAEPAAALTQFEEPHPSGVFQLTAKAIAACNRLGALLKACRGLPIAIASVQPAAPELRYTSVFPPVQHPLLIPDEMPAPEAGQYASQVVPVMPIVISFERNSNWPDSLEAIQRTKTAFYLRIADGLRPEPGVFSIVSQDYVDVMLDGFAFRVFIYQSREQFLLELAAKRALFGPGPVGVGGVTMGSSAIGFVNPGPVPRGTYVGSASTKSEPAAPDPHAPEVVRAATVRRDCVLRPQHGSRLHGFHLKFPCFGGTVRLVKRWFAAHLFWEHMEEEAIELIVAVRLGASVRHRARLTLAPQFVFLTCAESQVPQSASSGLLRVLRLLATWDWAGTPMFVDVNADGDSKADFSTLAARFKWYRTSRPHDGAMFIVTPAVWKAAYYLPVLAVTLGVLQEAADWQPVWTSRKPETIVVARIAAFANASYATLAKAMSPAHSTSVQESWKPAFHTPLTDYDALIDLNLQALPPFNPTGSPVLQGEEHTSKLVVPLHKNLRSTSRKALLVGYDPLQMYLHELRSLHGNHAWFFANPFGGSAIGIVWRRDVLKCSPADLLLALKPAETAKRGKKRAGAGQETSKVAVQPIRHMISEACDFATIGAGLVAAVHIKP